MDPPESPKLVSQQLRLMCSYGGHILPRPHDKTLCYIGGDTRIIVSDRNVSLNDLTSRLSKTLLNNKPFSLKYQLPNEDLDSLISVTTDEDFENMVEEYDRLVLGGSGKVPSRIRMFLFTEPKDTSSFGSAKSEDWFLNALNGSSQVGSELGESASVNCLLGLDDVVVDNGEVKEVPRKQQEVHSVPDSPIMDTSSSFGSTSSSAAMGNLAPIRVRVEDQKPPPSPPPQRVEGKTEDGGFFVVSAPAPIVVRGPASAADLASPDSISSDTSLANSLSRQKNVMYPDPALQIQMQTQTQNQNPNQNQNMSSNRVPSPIDQKLSDSNPNYLFPTQYEQHYHQLNSHQHQQQPQYIQSGSQYIPQGAVPAPAYYIVYPTQQQYPSPYVSARPTQPYNIQSSYAPSMGSSQNPQQFVASSQNPQQFGASSQNPQQFMASSQNPQQFMASSQNPQQFMASSQNPQQFMASSQNPQQFMASSQNPQQFMGYPPIHQSQSLAPSSATGNYAYEYADPSNPRMVYSQQMAPQMAVQYQNTPPVLSEASSQVSNESFKQQNRTAQS